MRLVLWACSSAGRAPALQVSRVNSISAASGVAYAETRGATTLSNWTEIGPTNLASGLWGNAVVSAVSHRRSAQEHSNLQLFRQQGRFQTISRCLSTPSLLI